MAALVPALEVNRGEQVAHGLATAMLAGPWQQGAVLARARDALGRPRAPGWLTALVGEVLAAYRQAPTDRPRELAAFVQASPNWVKAWQHRRPPHIITWSPRPTRIVHRRWPVAELNDLTDLARLLDVDQGELAWLCDVRSLERRGGEAVRHYRWFAQPRPGGIRLVAAPKPRLKEAQRRVLRHVLAAIPLAPAAHGGVPDHSVRSAVTPHAGAGVVIRVDLQSFFNSIPAGRIWNLLRFAGLPEPVAHAITGLVTTVLPLAVEQRYRHQLEPLALARLRTPHLPIGAPTSPALANALCFTLDRRLSGAADKFGSSYTRYVDDLTFSGGGYLDRHRRRFLQLLDTVVRAEGFSVNDRKTVILSAAGRQAMLGAVVNQRPTLSRPERDALRAILHNCARYGWRSQARDRVDFPGWLRGRIAWAAAIDPPFGARLLADHQRLDWS
ncbi:MAG TPA: reverse transcriptase family protein [Jatrophihabitans sp.]|nr:reverse transcriptase family protein [Jatrophihabitans sp.]